MRVVAFDFETHKIKQGCVTPRPVCLAWNDGTREALLDRFAAHAWLRAQLLDPDVVLVGHNIAYDLGVAAAEWPGLVDLIFSAYEAGRIVCTEVRQALIDVAYGEGKFRRTRGVVRKANTSLAELVWHHKGVVLPKADTWQLRYGQLDGIPIANWPPDAVSYPLRDARETYDIFQLQCALLASVTSVWARHRVTPLHDEAHQNRAAWALHLTACWGMRTDDVMVTRLDSALQAEHLVAEAHLIKVGLHRADGSCDTKRLRAMVDAAYRARGAEVPMSPPSKSFPNGQIKISGEVLEATADPDLLVKASVAECENIRRNWLDTLRLGAKLPICARYRPVLETGRVSCAKPNMMNPPRGGGVRECFVPRVGYLYAFADYDTLELRTLAQECLELVGWSALADALNNGADPHLGLAAALLGITEADAVARMAAGDKQVEEWRQLSKVANFGFPGGMVAATFVEYAAGYGMAVPLATAMRLHAGWHQRWPEMRHYFNIIKGMLQGKRGTIVQSMSLRVRGDVGFCAAANSRFQGRAADGAKEALWRVAVECYTGRRTDGKPGVSPLYGSRMVVFMHDELGLEVPEAGSSAAAVRLGEVMVESMTVWVPRVTIKAGPVLMRRWLKGAKPVKVGGNLVPSKPQKVMENGKERTKWVADV